MAWHINLQRTRRLRFIWEDTSSDDPDLSDEIALDYRQLGEHTDLDN